MRLLDTNSFEVKEFIGHQIPNYVILSHRWEDEEVTFQDIQDLDQVKSKKGFGKIVACCQKAASDGFQWVWIDTCCIDKSSSAELSEAVNSMYQWYSDARICYAYLADIPDDCLQGNIGTVKEQLQRSAWFRRGWTLQELIAPQVVEFYSAGWIEIGTKLSHIEELSSITGINVDVLRGTKSPADCNVAYRMSWAASRETTRIEDRAYSLLGIFQINMPLLYGEGPRAFRRLQEEIMKNTEDYTIFAWTGPQTRQELVNGAQQLGSSHGILASAPDRFDNRRFQTYYGHSYCSLSKSVKVLALQGRLSSAKRQDVWSGPPTLTSRGVLMEATVCRPADADSNSDSIHHICLTCLDTDTGVFLLCIPLERVEPLTILNNGRPAFKRPRLATAKWLHFVPLNDLGQQKLEYLAIYWIPTETSAEAQIGRPANSLPVWLSLSISGGCYSTEYLLPSASTNRALNTFELGRLLRYFRDPTARAVFKIAYSLSKDVTVFFIVVFGFVGRRIPLCGVSQVYDGTIERELSDINFFLERGAKVDNPDQGNSDGARRNVASEAVCLGGARHTALLSGYSTLLNTMKDRADQDFAGFKIKVAVRR